MVWFEVATLQAKFVAGALQCFSWLVPYNENKVALDLQDTQCLVG